VAISIVRRKTRTIKPHMYQSNLLFDVDNLDKYFCKEKNIKEHYLYKIDSGDRVVTNDNKCEKFLIFKVSKDGIERYYFVNPKLIEEV